MRHITETGFWRQLMDDVYGARSGDAIVVIDAKDARKGVGKTACAVGLARLCAGAFGYELSEEDLCLSGERYLDRLRNHPDDEPSVVVWDEAVGAGSGDSRRSMAEQNLVMGRAWQTMRTKQTLSMVTLPDWNLLDKRLQKLADYRIYCLDQPIGYFQGYRIGTAFKNGEVQTYGLPKDADGAKRIRFPNVDKAEDDLYQALEAKKAQLLDSDDFDADEIIEQQAAADGGQELSREEIKDRTQRQEAIRTVLRATEWNDNSIETASNLVDYSREWCRNRVNEYRDKKKHGDLLTDD